MNSLGDRYKALVIGSSYTIGMAFATALKNDPNCRLVACLSRNTVPDFCLENEASISYSASLLASEAPFHLIIDATGALTIDGQGPEKQLSSLNPIQLSRAFQINTIGPALIIKHFFAIARCKKPSHLCKIISAGDSISDNQKGD
jgi:hypothetical protein